MGKKLATNSKAEEGRARKAAAKEEKNESLRREKELVEEKTWKEGAKDESKRQAEEAKRLEKLIKKQEKRELEDQEDREAAKCKPRKAADKHAASPIVTLRTANWSLSLSDEGSTTHSIEAYSASNIDDALLLLDASTQSPATTTVEKHPERRMKAAFSAFEAREMPKLRAEHPTLRHTQLMERLYKMWQKSPDNPFNQLHVAHNLSREEQTQIVQADIDKNLERLRLN